jgi:hypothetical protein
LEEVHYETTVPTVSDRIAQYRNDAAEADAGDNLAPPLLAKEEFLGAEAVVPDAARAS